MSDQGCGWRVTFLALGVFALAASALFLLGVASSWWQGQTISKWPSANATIQHCKVDQRKRRRVDRYVYYAICSISFDANGERVKGGIESLPAYYEQRKSAWANPGISELRAWVAQHPDGSKLAVHYDPEWHPKAVPYPTPELFDYSRNAGTLKFAGIAAMVAVVLIGIPFVIPR